MYDAKNVEFKFSRLRRHLKECVCVCSKKVGERLPYINIRELKGQLQRFHKLSLFDRFRHVENGLDINF